MKYFNGTKIEDDNLEWIYPQRCMIGEHYELWRFPYVKDGVLHERDDFVLALLNGKRNYLHIFTKPDRVSYLTQLGRIQWLIHDISEEFDSEYHPIEDLDEWDPDEHIAEFEKLRDDFLQS